jgi:uncharacterized protein
MSTLQPTTATERHVLLDVLRGFALLGVLLANMVTHSGYFFLSDESREAMTSIKADHIAEWIEHFLIDGKFYSLFSMLFGIGFALQMKRSSSLDDRFLSRFSRRLLMMFILGLLHAIFLYVGDILTVYAITALFLLLFRNSPDKTLIRAAIILMIIPVIQYGIMLAIHLSSPPPVIAEPEGPRFFDIVINAYRTGSFREIMEMNAGGLVLGRYPDLLFTGRFFRVLGMFLVGLYIARHQLYAQVEANRALIRKTMIWGAIIGIPCNIILAMMMTGNAYYGLEPIGIIQPIVYAFGVPALCLFYAAAIALLFNSRKGKWLMIFAPVGQMALTNYLMQSVICALIFMSYGLGREAMFGPAKLSLIALCIYLFQVMYSPVWLRFFRFGPMEWLWRSATYKKWQPFRR